MAHRILIVEDDESVRAGLLQVLRRQGYEVETANGFEEACELLRNHSYSLVFTDLRLGEAGELEGFDILRQIRQTSPLTRTVILTGGADADMRKRAMIQRADAFLLKPFGMGELSAVAARLLGSAQLIA